MSTIAFEKCPHCRAENQLTLDRKEQSFNRKVCGEEFVVECEVYLYVVDVREPDA